MFILLYVHLESFCHCTQSKNGFAVLRTSYQKVLQLKVTHFGALTFTLKFWRLALAPRVLYFCR